MLQRDFVKRYWTLPGQLSVHQLLEEELLHAVCSFKGFSFIILCVEFLKRRDEWTTDTAERNDLEFNILTL